MEIKKHINQCYSRLICNRLGKIRYAERYHASIISLIISKHDYKTHSLLQRKVMQYLKLKKITYQNKDLNASQIPLLSKPMLSTVEKIENITDVHFSKVLYNVFRHVSTL